MSDKKVDLDKLYEQFHKLKKTTKRQPKELKAKNGVFLLNPNDKHQREWFENDEDFGGYGDEEKDGE